MQMARTQLAPKTPATRSSVTNGSRVLVGVDGRSAGARRYRDLIDGLTRELGGELSAAEQLAVRNAASLQLHSENLTAAQARGEHVEADAITRAANGATRALTALRRLRPSKDKRRSSLSELMHARRVAAE